MKSLRLNQQLRDAIVNNFADKRSKAQPRPDETVTRESLKKDLANSVYDSVYGEVDLSKVPEDMLNVEHYIKVQFPSSDPKEEGTIESLSLGRDEEGKAIYKPATRNSKVEYVLTKSDPLYKEYKRKQKLFKQEQEAIKEYDNDHKRYIQQVRQVVTAVNTTKQLLEVWPEAEQFIPDDIRDPSTITLPSVNIADLNSQI